MNNRRLSLNITSTAPRRQSLTVEGLSSAFKDLAASSGNATGSLRNKAALKPGHSLMGWINLTATAKDLNGLGGKTKDISLSELAKHDTADDCWVSIKDNVYNVTPYLQYHPGGVDELLRGAGTDATDLFSEVHSWVNYESILAKCYVGPLLVDPIPSSTILPPPATSPALSKSSSPKISPNRVTPSHIATTTIDENEDAIANDDSCKTSEQASDDKETDRFDKHDD